MPATRINTGEEALFRLSKNPESQVQNRGFWGFVKLAHLPTLHTASRRASRLRPTKQAPLQPVTEGKRRMYRGLTRAAIVIWPCLLKSTMDIVFKRHIVQITQPEV
ncbi:MAG: hypothetical protein DMG72_18235 [Acidobacteria bacterium]|nr:MAG: hypothetical protein DMG72_18235 [Acidobacteriota bacterium]